MTFQLAILVIESKLKIFKVWGRTTNPYNPRYSCGGSSGGEAALIALGGSRIGVGSDVAGSVRVPAHFSGCYSLRCSVGRWPKAGIDSSTLGQEGVPSVFSPMARTLNDLVYFTRSVIQMKPWKYDHSAHQIVWREEIEKEIREIKGLNFGVMWTDGRYYVYCNSFRISADILKGSFHHHLRAPEH